VGPDGGSTAALFAGLRVGGGAARGQCSRLAAHCAAPRGERGECAARVAVGAARLDDDALDRHGRPRHPRRLRQDGPHHGCDDQPALCEPSRAERRRTVHCVCRRGDRVRQGQRRRFGRRPRARDGPPRRRARSMAHHPWTLAPRLWDACGGRTSGVVAEARRGSCGSSPAHIHVACRVLRSWQASRSSSSYRVT